MATWYWICRPVIYITVLAYEDLRFMHANLWAVKYFTCSQLRIEACLMREPPITGVTRGHTPILLMVFLGKGLYYP